MVQFGLVNNNVVQRAVTHQFKNSEITRDELLRKTAAVVRAVGEYLEQGGYTAPELKASRFCKNLLERFFSLGLFLEK